MRLPWTPLLLAVPVGCGAGGEGFSLTGSLTWTLAFDADAKQRGLEDCDYERKYTGSEDRSAPWLCLGCDAMARVDSTLKRGKDCRAQIAEGEVSPEEWLGWGRKGFFRASNENYALSEHGSVVWDGDQGEVTYTTEWLLLEEGGHVKLQVEGLLERGSSKADVMWGYTPPETSSCGWERVTAEPYSGNWKLREGKKIPDGFFLDACEEGVRLHELLGRSLVISVSAADCPPCRDMAEGEPAALQDMREAGLSVEAVTLLAPSLSGVIDPIGARRLNNWTEDFGLDAPVLGDRGWGYWLGEESLGAQMGYPMVIVTDPEGTVTDIRSGFSSWDEIAAEVAATQ